MTNNTVEQLKSKFASNYYKAVNEPLTPAQDKALREEFRELEDSLMGKMDEKDFQEFYDLVHKAAWGNNCYDDYS